MKDLTKAEIADFLSLTTKQTPVEKIDFCLRQLYESNTKGVFDQVLGGTQDILSFGELIGALESARYDLLYAHALDLTYENKPVPEELLIELGLIDKPIVRRTK